jgi:DNA invertase Pin-like site-specific DNA recombinase
MATTRRVALYARVSTADQIPENQLLPLRAFATARGWEATEYTDRTSGAKDRRPGLDQLLAAARSRKLDVVAVVKLDRLARSLRHLVTLAAEFEALGVDLVVLDQAVDTTTPAGKLLFHVVAAMAEFERDLIRERVKAGMKRARVHGKHLGRPRVPVDLGRVAMMKHAGRSLRYIAKELGVSAMAVSRALAARSA